MHVPLLVPSQGIPLILGNWFGPRLDTESDGGSIGLVGQTDHGDCGCGRESAGGERKSSCWSNRRQRGHPFSSVCNCRVVVRSDAVEKPMHGSDVRRCTHRTVLDSWLIGTGSMLHHASLSGPSLLGARGVPIANTVRARPKGFEPPTF
jgi:hypothetical protein